MLWRYCALFHKKDLASRGNIQLLSRHLFERPCMVSLPPHKVSIIGAARIRLHLFTSSSLRSPVQEANIFCSKSCWTPWGSHLRLTSLSSHSSLAWFPFVLMLLPDSHRVRSSTAMNWFPSLLNVPIFQHCYVYDLENVFHPFYQISPFAGLVLPRGALTNCVEPH